MRFLTQRVEELGVCDVYGVRTSADKVVDGGTTIALTSSSDGAAGRLLNSATMFCPARYSNSRPCGPR